LPGFDDRGICSICSTTESLKHILTRCTAPGQELVWDMVENLWERKTGRRLRPSFGEIIACGSMKEIRTPKGRTKTGTMRLFRIVVSESAHLIWRLRNERV
ncbi:hypothetical protein C8J56DRAFT_728289, partial [Mycena floridula]